MSMKGCVGTALAAVLIAIASGPVLADGAAGSPGAAVPAKSAAAAASATAPATDDDFVAKVRKAVVDHDLDFFDKVLVDWDGARKRTQRLTLFQIRECFGRPIKSVGLEPLKPDPAAPLVPEGYRTNLPVTHLLRIAFDERHGPEETPACVFMLSKDPKMSYRMVLVLPTAPPPK